MLGEVKKKSLLTRVLEKRGINKKEIKFIREEKLDFPELKQAVLEVFAELFAKEDRDLDIGVHYDVDVDGLYSGYIMEDFLKRAGFKNVHNFINPRKKHGIVEETIDWAISNNLKWLFVVDSGSTNHEQIQILADNGVHVVVLDHHPYKEKDLAEGCWLVNISKYPNLPKISGCGVTFRFIEGIAEYMDNFEVDIYEKFVGITTISDMMDMSYNENRYYVKKAFDGRESTELFRKIPFWGSNMTFYGWQLIPYLNAMIRIGAEKRAVATVNNMNNPLKMKRTPEEITRVKGLQKQLMEELAERSRIKVSNHVVLCLRKGGDKLQTLNGLVGNQLVGEYQRSALVLFYDNDLKLWKGSFRGYQFIDKDLNEWGFKTMGHPQACGVEVSHENLIKFYKEAQFPEYEKKKADIYVDETEVTDSDFYEIAQFNEYTGTNFPKITVGFKEGTSCIEQIEEDRGKRVLILNKFEVIDFDKESEIGVGLEQESLVVTPTLSLNHYQLIKE